MDVRESKILLTPLSSKCKALPWLNILTHSKSSLSCQFHIAQLFQSNNKIAKATAILDLPSLSHSHIRIHKRANTQKTKRRHTITNTIAAQGRPTYFLHFIQKKPQIKFANQQQQRQPQKVPFGFWILRTSDRKSNRGNRESRSRILQLTHQQDKREETIIILLPFLVFLLIWVSGFIQPSAPSTKKKCNLTLWWESAPPPRLYSPLFICILGLVGHFAVMQFLFGCTSS